jgi:hypothetical protein
MEAAISVPELQTAGNSDETSVAMLDAASAIRLLAQPGEQTPPEAGWPEGDEELANRFLDIELRLAAALEGQNFSGTKVTHVSNPLRHALVPHTDFVRRYLGTGRKKYLFLGMNPGPWGMCQTGVPFGEVSRNMSLLPNTEYVPVTVFFSKFSFFISVSQFVLSNH